LVLQVEGDVSGVGLRVGPLRVVRSAHAYVEVVGPCLRSFLTGPCAPRKSSPIDDYDPLSATVLDFPHFPSPSFAFLTLQLHCIRSNAIPATLFLQVIVIVIAATTAEAEEATA